MINEATNKRTIEGNKLITEFMDKSFNCRIRYHERWDWLMPVVYKIESMGFEFSICRDSSLIMNDYTKLSEPITLEKLPANKRFEVSRNGRSKIESAWESVVQFIAWHNKKATL